MNLKVAVIDDNAIDAAYEKQIVEQWASLAHDEIYIGLFPNAESFLFQYAEDKQWDALILDIEMGKIDGVSLAKKIRSENETAQIIFATGYSDYIAEGYEVAALHYLMKPLQKEKVFSVLNRAKEKIILNQSFIDFEAYGELLRVPLHEIMYLDVDHNYVTIHAKKEYRIKCTLRQLEGDLDHRFYRVGRSLILNLFYIRRVSKSEVTLSDGSILPLPRGAYEGLNQAIIRNL